jgi:AraC family transcriptional regulator, regulatory protein of adaptative response / methylated-DNA-[protein]-cysteine methyltransferase
MTTHPTQHEDYQRIAQAIEYLQANFKQQPTLDDLAAHLHLSTYHLQRLFQRWAGISPKRFVQYLTADFAQHRLRADTPTLDTAYDVGLSSTGRLHDLIVNVYAMTPGEYKHGGAGLDIRYMVADSPFGLCLIASTARGICHLAFVEDVETARAELVAQFPDASFTEDSEQLAPLARQIFELQSGALAIHIKGTNFQIRVWEALLKIPTGELSTYEEVAAAIGKPSAARAVGGAIGKNPVGYLIPCHRVIRKSGAISGYRWGSVRKQAIIGWESLRSCSAVDPDAAH